MEDCQIHVLMLCAKRFITISQGLSYAETRLLSATQGQTLNVEI